MVFQAAGQRREQHRFTINRKRIVHIQPGEFLLRRFLINSREQPRHLIRFLGPHHSDTLRATVMRFARAHHLIRIISQRYGLCGSISTAFHHPGRQLMPLYHLIKCSFGGFALCKAANG
ncbi:Uncharacterised protein [Shigella sonnei]|nr:Uncharacterised protein [Shigella sonnei]